jgi:Peptidase family M1 domain
MKERDRATGSRCPGCGREYEGKPPAYCYGCGAALGEGGGRPRKRRAALAAVAVILVLLLVAGGVAAGLYLTRDTGEKTTLPQTASQLKASIGTCEQYLNESGKALARGRTAGASVYSVKARLDTAGNQVSGDETVLFTNRTGGNLGEVVFRVYANYGPVRGQGPSAVISNARAAGKPTLVTLDGSLMHVALDGTLAPGGETVISFTFTESVPEVQGGQGGLESLMGGGSAGGYGVFGRDADIYDLGYVMPIVAGYRDGAWESREPAAFGDIADFDCSYFNVSFDVPEGFRVAATGVETGKGNAGGRSTYGFAAGPVRDFAVQASRGYQQSTRQVGSTLVTSFHLKDSADAGAKVAGYSASALEQYNKHFGPYPFTRLNVCEAPLAGGAAGMEFSGQIQIARMLYGSQGAKVPQSLKDLGGGNLDQLLGSLAGGLLGGTLEFVVAHEVCHQWWGLVVGSDSIGHPWMDEALTNYCSVLYFRWQHGEEEAKNQLQVEIELPFSAAGLLGGGDAVVDQPVDAFKNQEQYAAIVYSKGALFFQALEKQMGPAAFERSLRQYYEEYAFKNATPDELLQAFQANAGDPAAVAALHRRWILEKHAGEDIASTLPGGSLLQDLLNNLPNGTDLGPLQELLQQYLGPGDSMEQTTPGLPPQLTSPSIQI